MGSDPSLGRVARALAGDRSEKLSGPEGCAPTSGILESRFPRLLLETVGEAIISIDQEHRVVLFNREAERIFGYAAREVVGQPVHMLVPERFRAGHGEQVQGFILGGYQPRPMGKRWDIIGRRKNRQEFPAEASITRVEIDGAIVCTVILRDTSERRKLEEQLRQSQKMEAIGRLAGGIAHDFNNLITAIMGYSDLLLGRLDSQSPVREELLEIRKAGDRAAALTAQLLALGRKEEIQARPLDLNGIVTDLNKMLLRVMGEHITLETQLERPLGAIKADPGQMEQVLLNLAVNARDAMPQGGRLTVETANTVLDEAYVRSHPGVSPGPYVRLVVADEGCGMDEATRARIFEPFFSTKQEGKGTGLGLATVYAIVQRSGGHIEVSSRPGAGSAFRISLPRVDAEPAPEPQRVPSAGPVEGSETVLVVEDEEIVRSLIREMLRRHGYRVLEAGRVEDALRLCDQHDGPIHLLITDVVMPQMNGRELAERLLAQRPTIQVLFLSGYTDDAMAQHGGLHPEMPFLRKPFPPDSLMHKVRELLDSPGKEGAAPPDP